MKKVDHVVFIYLFAISAVCLIAAAVFFMWDHPEAVTLEEVDASVSVVSEESVTESISEPVLSTEDADVSADDVSGDEEAVAEEEAEPEIEKVENPYKDYFLQNSDMVAWLKIPDTEIDHPVMWTPGDENYYLYRNFNKEKDKYGVPILDTDSAMYPETSTNLIIHGHNIKNTTFYFLLQYKDETYYEEHPYIYLYGRDYEHIYQVMAVFRSKVYYTTDTCFKYYKFFNAYAKEEFDDFYDNVKDLALYDTGVTAEFGDKFLTLSTCSSHTENGRFVVVAKEIEPGDYYLPIGDEETSDTVSGNN